MQRPSDSNTPSSFYSIVVRDRAHAMLIEYQERQRADDAASGLDQLGISPPRKPPRRGASSKVLRKRERMEQEWASQVRVRLPDGSWTTPTPEPRGEGSLADRWLRKQRHKEVSRTTRPSA